MSFKHALKSSVFFAALCSSWVLFADGALARSAEGDDGVALEEKVEFLLEELLAQKKALEQKERDIEKQKKMLDEKMALLDKTLGKAEVLLGDYRGRGRTLPPEGPRIEASRSPERAQEEAVLSEARARGTQEVGTERKTESQKKPEVPSVAADEGGVLSPKGRLVIEPSIQYNRTSALRVAIEGFTVVPAINVGVFDINEIDRDILTAAVTGRVGLTDRLEVEVYVPYLWRYDSTIGRPVGVGTSTSVLNEIDGSGIGDIELAAHYQINNGREGWPFFIGNMRFKTITGEGPFDVPTDAGTGLQLEPPTGSGFYALQPSVSMLYPSDPAVFFSNIGYTYNVERDVGGSTGTVDPGDSVNASLGMGFSINDRTSFSLGYSHSIVFESEQNGQTLPNSQNLQVGSTTFGYSYQINDRVGLSFNLAAGVTDDAPDMQATLRVPIKFDLF